MGGRTAGRGVLPFFVAATTLVQGVAWALIVGDGSLDLLEASLHPQNTLSFYPMATAVLALLALLLLGSFFLRRDHQIPAALPFFVALLPLPVGFAAALWDCQETLEILNTLRREDIVDTGLHTITLSSYSAALGALLASALTSLAASLAAFRMAYSLPSKNDRGRRSRRLVLAGVLLGMALLSLGLFPSLRLGLLWLGVSLILAGFWIGLASMKSLRDARDGACRLLVSIASIASVGLGWLGWTFQCRSWYAAALDESGPEQRVDIISDGFISTWHSLVQPWEGAIALGFIVLIALVALTGNPALSLAGLRRARIWAGLATAVLLVTALLISLHQLAEGELIREAKQRTTPLYAQRENFALPRVAAADESSVTGLLILMTSEHVWIEDWRAGGEIVQVEDERLEEALSEALHSASGSDSTDHSDGRVSSAPPITVAVDRAQSITLLLRNIHRIANIVSDPVQLLVEHEESSTRPFPLPHPGYRDLRELDACRRFQRISVLRVTPDHSNQSVPQDGEQQEVQELGLRIIIDTEGMTLTASSGVLPTGCSRSSESEGPTIPNQLDSTPDILRLQECLHRIKDEYPNQNRITISTAGSLGYEGVAQIIATASSPAHRPLFSDIQLSLLRGDSVSRSSPER